MGVKPNPGAGGAPDRMGGAGLGRRGFLKWVPAVAAAGAAALAGIPSLLALVSPALRRSASQAWLKLGDAAGFNLGVPSRIDTVQTAQDAWVTVRTLRSVWLYTEDGEHFTAYNARCPHLGCAYGYDEAAGIFRCPCHNGLFDARTGAVLAGPPPRPLDTLEVKVEDGVVYVAYQEFQHGVPQKLEA
ncbi:MAG: Rieske (2Fe-2S) protein [Gemmatimonadetes bacterium]|nr:Rieske (2Fe-2S) protein [Gemmatimonadota bacterium]